MKGLKEMLKAARRLEWLLILALLAALLVLGMGGNAGGGANEEERRMERILSSIDGAGRVSVMLSRDPEGNCSGAVVSAGGADDLRVMLMLQSAVQALTNLELGQIEIVKSGS